jgi:TetR/AcrR family transcriptional repressor of nem operon
MTTHQKLIDSARYLIQTRGYNGFSYADVAEEVQVRKASIHHHFPTKADLALAVVEESRAGILQQISLIAEGEFDPVERLRFYIEYWERCITDATAPFCVAGMLAAELPSLPADLAEHVRMHFRDLSRWLETILTRGAQLGVFRFQGAASTEAEAFISLVYGAMLTARAYGDPSKFAEVSRGGLRRLVSGPAVLSQD